MTTLEIKIVKTPAFDPINMPLCPICDNIISGGESAVIITVANTFGLAHGECAEEYEDGN